MSQVTQRLIPENSREITRPHAMAIVYVYESNGIFWAIGYAGRKKNPAFRHWYKEEEQRDDYVNKFLDKQEADAVGKIRYRQEKKNFVTSLVQGEILYGSWGWEQTNVEFFEIIEVRSKNTIRIRSLVKHKSYSGDMSGRAMPIAGQYDGETQTVRLRLGDQCSAALCGLKVLLAKWDGEPKTFSEYA